VEIGDADQIRGDGRVAVVPLAMELQRQGSLGRRASRRLVASVRVRTQARNARRSLRTLRYDQAATITWDLAQPLRLPGFATASGRTTAELLPTRALVVGRRSPAEPTLFEAAITDASASFGRRLLFTAPSVRAGPLVAVGEEGVLRVAIGPARMQIGRQVAALEALRKGGAPELDTTQIPWVTATGAVGFATWSVERAHTGRPPRRVSASLVSECLDFLVGLHASRVPGVPAKSPVADAEIVGGVCSTSRASRVRALGASVADAVSHLPRGFAHGDFFHGNLLVGQDGGLRAVLDWDAAGPGRLPLLDLLHFRHLSEYAASDLDWGPALVSSLLPSIRDGDPIVREYCGRIGIEPSRRELTALVSAYWLDRVAYQLTAFADRVEQPLWLARNVEFVLDKLTAR
jgi:Phosphotransferase enzyme family